MDPFFTLPTLSLTCDIVDAITHQPYRKDPRTIAAKAEAYLKSTGIGDTSYFGPEPEFFVFDEVRFSEGPNRASYFVDSIEGIWNTDREEGPNLGYKPPNKGGYFPVPPTDTLTDLRAEMADDARGGRHPGRGLPPRGRDRRSVRAVDEVQQPQDDGRLDHVVQVRGQERRAQATARRRRSCRSRSSATTARACTATSRSGRTRRTCSPATGTPGSRRWRCTTSAASSSTRRRSAPSPTRARTATSGSCRATRRR